MKRIRAKIKARTGRARASVRDLWEVIRELNPILRGWGNYFRPGNASVKCVQIDGYVARRLRGLLRRRCGRNLRPGQFARWTSGWFWELGLHRLMGTIRYPGIASPC